MSYNQVKELICVNEIAKKLNKYFMESEMSYAELAKRTGIPKSALQRYIVGQTDKIPIDRLQSIAEALGTSAAVLMGWEEDETPSPTPEQQAKERIHELVDRLSPADLARVEAVIDAFLSTQEGKEPGNQ